MITGDEEEAAIRAIIYDIIGELAERGGFTPAVREIAKAMASRDLAQMRLAHFPAKPNEVEGG